MKTQLQKKVNFIGNEIWWLMIKSNIFMGQNFKTFFFKMFKNIWFKSNSFSNIVVVKKMTSSALPHEISDIPKIAKTISNSKWNRNVLFKLRFQSQNLDYTSFISINKTNSFQMNQVWSQIIVSKHIRRNIAKGKIEMLRCIILNGHSAFIDVARFAKLLNTRQ